MNNSALVEVLLTLSEKEWTQLACRPLLVSKDRSSRLFRYLQRHIHEDKKLEKRLVFEALYAKEKYDNQRLREDMSQVFSEVKNFLIENELFCTGYFTNYLLLSALGRKKALKAYQRTLNSLDKAQAERTVHDEWYYLNQALTVQKKEELMVLRPRHSADMERQEKIEGLDIYYMLSKLKLYCEQLNRMNILNIEYQPLLMKEILNVLQRHDEIRKFPQVAVYYHIVLLLLNPDEEGHFKKLVKELAANKKEFSHEEARNLYRYVQNYCIRKINQGVEAYYAELLNIYRQLLTSELILDNGQIDHTDYKNIVTTGLRLKDYKWTINFIENYRTLLHKDFREGAYLYNKANYLYEAGEPAKASDLLLNQNFSDVYYNLSARHLLLKIFYDEEEFESLNYQIESFRVFLGRNKTISKTNKDSNVNFLKVMRRLASARQQQDYLKETMLQKRITGIIIATNKYDPLANKSWLLEKADTIKSSLKQ